MVKHDGSDKGFLRVLIKKLRSRDPFDVFGSYQYV